jgi:hypothetical protein
VKLGYTNLHEDALIGTAHLLTQYRPEVGPTGSTCCQQISCHRDLLGEGFDLVRVATQSLILVHWAIVLKINDIK